MFRQYLAEQIKLHLSMQPQDIIKLCYQATFGAEHLLGDMVRVKGYFDTEFLNTPENDAPLAEFLTEDVCRVNLAAWKKLKIPQEWLFNLFVQAAGVKRDGGEASFWEYMSLAEGLPFDASEWQTAVNEYKKGGVRPVHHSEKYREAEKPAYRIISGIYTRLIPLFRHIKPEGMVVAIDGRAASGKSTMASMLAEITEAGIVHMDDFFLPKELRTRERFAIPGGNFHHERFAEEVLPFLRSEDAFSYRKFDCSVMDFAGVREVAKSPLRIIEGAYCCAPMLGEYMDLRVFSDISPTQQHARIEKRNGIEIAAQYTSKWIPMEEEYLQFHQIKDRAHVVL